MSETPPKASPHHPVLDARYIVLSILSSLMMVAGLIGQFAPASVVEGIFGSLAPRIEHNGWVLIGLAVVVGVYNAITTLTRKRAALKRKNGSMA